MFGDFSMQAIYNNVKNGNELIEVLEDRASFIRFKLNVNCRNTKPICIEIQTITGIQNPKDLWLKVDGMPVQYITWKSTEDEAIQLDKLLDKLYKSGVAQESITILSSKKKEDSVISTLNRKDIHNYKVSQNQFTTFSTIQSFKGLENTVIIVVDVEDFTAEKLMYVALSRACAGLYVFESESAKKEYDSLLFKRLTNG
jgi:DNA helicase IV